MPSNSHYHHHRSLESISTSATAFSTSSSGELEIIELDWAACGGRCEYFDKSVWIGGVIPSTSNYHAVINVSADDDESGPITMYIMSDLQVGAMTVVANGRYVVTIEAGTSHVDIVQDLLLSGNYQFTIDSKMTLNVGNSIQASQGQISFFGSDMTFGYGSFVDGCSLVIQTSDVDGSFSSIDGIYFDTAKIFAQGTFNFGGKSYFSNLVGWYLQDTTLNLNGDAVIANSTISVKTIVLDQGTLEIGAGSTLTTYDNVTVFAPGVIQLDAGSNFDTQRSENNPGPVHLLLTVVSDAGSNLTLGNFDLLSLNASTLHGDTIVNDYLDGEISFVDTYFGQLTYYISASVNIESSGCTYNEIRAVSNYKSDSVYYMFSGYNELTSTDGVSSAYSTQFFLNVGATFNISNGDVELLADGSSIVVSSHSTLVVSNATLVVSDINVSALQGNGHIVIENSQITSHLVLQRVIVNITTNSHINGLAEASQSTINIIVGNVSPAGDNDDVVYFAQDYVGFDASFNIISPILPSQAIVNVNGQYKDTNGTFSFGLLQDSKGSYPQITADTPYFLVSSPNPISINTTLCSFSTPSATSLQPTFSIIQQLSSNNNNNNNYLLTLTFN
ncbi:hypothetical protein DFA_09311 [Cavenderia fasciculata]|uniref:Uncharacterized protein n=1 Tax=Cavenderia fasciculata TaxID=261658 RepID=F4Q799_CACFS|nr:uncharacterized protein DFA_09311 [Cavenderia fasciculata]EGG16281.1 hypothetical protein DFA_09311 [Cavenderia fasciculata]|eukprot:XP_004354665.1 hypothetical protein DFA_09311 [Cavenderia fasciculata]